MIQLVYVKWYQQSTFLCFRCCSSCLTLGLSCHLLWSWLPTVITSSILTPFLGATYQQTVPCPLWCQKWVRVRDTAKQFSSARHWMKPLLFRTVPSPRHCRTVSYDIHIDLCLHWVVCKSYKFDSVIIAFYDGKISECSEVEQAWTANNNSGRSFIGTSRTTASNNVARPFRRPQRRRHITCRSLVTRKHDSCFIAL